MNIKVKDEYAWFDLEICQKKSWDKIKWHTIRIGLSVENKKHIYKIKLYA